MNQNLNPYQPPPAAIADDSWWQRLLGYLWPSLSISRRFQEGTPVICYGVLFFVTPDDRQSLHIALPSSDVSARGMQRIVDEAVRVLPYFAFDFPGLRRLVVHRKAVVRMIESYREPDDERWARVTLDPGALRDAFGRVHESLPPVEPAT